jgi:hypothetical protein
MLEKRSLGRRIRIWSDGGPCHLATTDAVIEASACCRYYWQMFRGRSELVSWIYRCKTLPLPEHNESQCIAAILCSYGL